MLNKILFIILISLFLLSCGKKGDPVYEEPKAELTIT
tara:strand:- start:431 stop:541 length:111 start_codon:yes stop_codon:yes gene_type:complete